MKGNRIYIVMGSTGEYEYFADWVVGYSKSEVFARKFAERLTALAKNVRWNMVINEKNKLKHSELFRIDKNFSTTYTGTDYYVVPAEPLNENEKNS